MKANLKKLESIKIKALTDFEKVKTLDNLEEIRIKYLGRKSELTQLLRLIKDLPKKDRATFGSEANKAKESIENSFNRKKDKIITDKEVLRFKNFDITAPGMKQRIGHIHPLTQMIWKIEDIFGKMGFEVFEPYDIDDDYHNFTSLNMPEGHPARDIWDTFWTEDGFIPITHTSSMQNRIYKSRKPPIRATVIGNTYRNERTDARHEHSLIQCEGVYVDKGISLSDMIGTLKTFFESFFQRDIDFKLDPDYFPFVEPGNGMSLSCVLCNMKGCRVCKDTGWLEILGCGMIHPEVLREGGIDPDVYSGFAWGFGVDRLVMLKYKIEDIRHFRSGDLRFIRQF